MAEEETPPPGNGGKKLSRNAKIGVGVGAVVLAYLYYRHQQSQAAAAAVNPADQTVAQPTDTGVPLGTDTGPGSYGTNYSAASSSTIGNVSTNADWFNAALQACENAGYDAQTASVALSAFLASQPLTAQQQQIVRIGLAAAGQPPQGPTGIVTAPTPTGGTGITAPGTPILYALGSTYFTITWIPVTGAHGYYVYTGGAKSPLLHGALYTLNTHNANTPILPGRQYQVTVTAVDAGGAESAHSPALTVTTKKK